MANVTLNSRVVVRNDTASNWNTSNPILLKGEIGFELGGSEIKFKIGDGTNTWSNLPYFEAGLTVLSGVNAPATSTAGKLGQLYYASSNQKLYMCYTSSGSIYVWKQIVSPDDLSDLGVGDMLKSLYDTNNDGKVDVSESLYNSAANQNATIDDNGAASTDVIYTSKKIDDTYVAKVDGKGLSTNDYTTAEKTKLAGIADGAEANVQSDWNETDSTSDAFIKNKPTSMPADGGNADTVDNKHVDDTKDTDGYLWTASKIKSYADSLIEANNAMVFKGVVSSTNPLPSTGYKIGWTYKVGETGTYAGNNCEVNDTIICIKSYVSPGANSDWYAIQANIDGAVTSSVTTSVDGDIVVFDGTSGKIIKAGGKKISDLEYTLPVMSNTVLGGAKAANSISDNASSVVEVARRIAITSDGYLAAMPEVLISTDTYILDGGNASNR